MEQGVVSEVERDPNSESPTAFEEFVDKNKTAYLRDEESYKASTDLEAAARGAAGLEAALDRLNEEKEQQTEIPADSMPDGQSTPEGQTDLLPPPLEAPAPPETEPETEPREIDTLINMSPVTKYAGSTMNIRTAPDAESEIVAYVDTGAELIVNGETTNWYRVMVDQKVGFAAKYLVTDEYTPVYGELASTCYMRSYADYGDNIIGEYYGGTQLEILEDHGGWTKVRIDGVDGFVGTKFVTRY